MSHASVRSLLRRAATRAAGLLLAAPRVAQAATPAAAPAAAGPLAQARQLVVVVAPDWNAPGGRLHRFERDAAGVAWREVAAFEVSLGRNGSAWGEGLHAAADAQAGPLKREGDGRSPAGIFRIGPAFGYAAGEDARLPYLQMDAGHYCIDVPASPLYNRIVDAREVGTEAVEGSTEPMRLDLHNNGDPRYRLGFVIDHNPLAVPGRGSCIFAHLWRRAGEPTAGCTAMDDAHMQALLAWLDPAAMPRFVLLPRDQYARLATGWQLPALEAGE